MKKVVIPTISSLLDKNLESKPCLSFKTGDEILISGYNQNFIKNIKRVKGPRLVYEIVSSLGHGSIYLTDKTKISLLRGRNIFNSKTKVFHQEFDEFYCKFNSILSEGKFDFLLLGLSSQNFNENAKISLNKSLKKIVNDNPGLFDLIDINKENKTIYFGYNKNQPDKKEKYNKLSAASFISQYSKNKVTILDDFKEILKMMMLYPYDNNPKGYENNFCITYNNTLDLEGIFPGYRNKFSINENFQVTETVQAFTGIESLGKMDVIEFELENPLKNDEYIMDGNFNYIK